MYKLKDSEKLLKFHQPPTDLPSSSSYDTNFHLTKSIKDSN